MDVVYTGLFVVNANLGDCVLRPGESACMQTEHTVKLQGLLATLSAGMNTNIALLAGT